MTTNQKRYPALTDTDPMPFGKHKGELMQDVPASYLRWLWEEGLRPLSKDYGDGPPPGYAERIKLANYIWNSKEAIEQELGEPLCPP